MLTMAVEFFPVVAEWAKLEKARKFLSSLTLGAVIFGICLSILHQSGLGALFLMAKPKIHLPGVNYPDRSASIILSGAIGRKSPVESSWICPISLNSNWLPSVWGGAGKAA
jgi:hypothetical protein